MGLTIYTMDWCKILNNLSSKIEGIQICPLVPVLNDSIPGSLARDLIALAYWLVRRYEGSTLGLLHAWSHLAGRVAELTHVGPSLPVFHSVALPNSLASGAPLTVSNSQDRAASTHLDLAERQPATFCPASWPRSTAISALDAVPRLWR